ncbi:hypothetical protein FSP39_017566 [Pinctada imbricata]|uniref:Uncharacterized protein n=1 Tax=Pinctada imbricata TaxID=66713 RepID=A0AA88XSZ2_PINIB|nr:hypothetical protein FSP39_017566 [Pinctada imbricata]
MATMSAKGVNQSKYFTSAGKDLKKTTQPPKVKRHISEVSETSADELTLIAGELKEMREELQGVASKSEIKEIKEDLQNLVKKDDLKEIVKDFVTEIMTEMKKEMNKRFEEMSEKNRKTIGQLTDKIDSLSMENNLLKEKLADREKQVRMLNDRVDNAEIIARDAQKRSNYNEQYSRKNNVKLHGIPEADAENTSDTVQKVLKDVAQVDLHPEEILAVHRISGKPNEHRPILLKVKNTEVKARIMRKRSVVKRSGKRLTDDVTRLNSKLIQELNGCDEIEQAWYFNGNVYGKVKGGRRLQFDIFDNIQDKIKR